MLALGYQELEMRPNQIPGAQRDEVESNLQFLGFLIMQNKLKPATIDAI